VTRGFPVTFIGETFAVYMFCTYLLQIVQFSQPFVEQLAGVSFIGSIFHGVVRRGYLPGWTTRASSRATRANRAI
jgi:hypothetical protein